MKRSTDTNKWKKRWFSDLPSKYKLFWLYICDECDHAGVWIVNFKLASVMIGEDFTEEETFKALGGQVVSFDDGERWFIKGFLRFHYGDFLTTNNGFHNSVIKLIQKYRIAKYTDIEIIAKSRVTHAPQALARVTEDEVMQKPLTLAESFPNPKGFLIFRTEQELIDELTNSHTWLESTSRATSVSVKLLIDALPQFAADVFAGRKQNEGINEIMSYFKNWVPKKLIAPTNVKSSRKFGEFL